MANPKQVILRNARIAFPELWEPKRFGDDTTSKPRYSCTFLIEKDSDNDKAIRAAIVRTATERFKEGAKALLAKIKDNSGTCAYIDGDTCTSAAGEVYNGFAGMMALRTNRQEKYGAPKIVNGRNIPVKPGDKGAPYSGCFVNAIVEPFPYSEKSRGISCGLVLVQFAKDGESFGGASTVADDALEAVETEETEDEIPF